MAFGFPPKFVHDINPHHIRKEHLVAIAIEAAVRQKWNIQAVNAEGFSAAKYSWNNVSEELTVRIKNDSISIKSSSAKGQLFDWGKNKKNVTALIFSIYEIRDSLSFDEMEAKCVEFAIRYPTKEEHFFGNPIAKATDNITGISSVFTPTEGYFITPIMINLNILVFIAMGISGVYVAMPDIQDLMDWGANFRPLVFEGQWWRLLTASFLHGGILHILFNLLSIFWVGLLLEPFLGRTRFLAAYLLSAVATSLASLWWHEFTVGAGASGVVFGLLGVSFALLTTKIIRTSVRVPLFIIVVAFLAYAIFNGFKENSGVDNVGHLGGLICGLIIGYSFIPSLKKRENLSLKLATVGALSLLLLVFAFLIYKTAHSDISKYKNGMMLFGKAEKEALEIYKLPSATPREELLTKIKDIGIHNWNENLKRLDSFENLELPIRYKEKNKQLREYCQLRIKSYELMYQGINEDTDNYIENIVYYNQKIMDIKKLIREE